ncbi:leucine-rich repeat-containing protein kinase family protein [Limnohabitans sp. B9-3]|uniref:leucine-rich repeat-containing protein kinase family protein n=1 Tax=Limnohabitans sp. B9-3 TaxID=1100707 RepID=UPI000C1F201A|nr:leucine-rich repeat-containing protein kinase family protein [Limnohabitans sp. B9-3]PIT73630.1 protein kinase [Limnohabitans sp. B9-3]
MHTLSQLRAGELHGITRLQLREGLTTFPPEIFELADTLEILDLSGNQLTALPNDLPRLHKLQVIFGSDNPFTELPEVLGQCPNLTMVGFKANRIRHVSAKALPPRLRWLILTDNQIDTLPTELGHCTDLQKLMLAGNRLSQLPETMVNLQKLELLRISANQFTALPKWLLELPRLSWLAFAGNPFCADLEASALANAATQAIDWADLEVEALLGEGASGLIYRANWTPAKAHPTRSQHVSSSATISTDLAAPVSASTPLAVKVFKGSLTSDGLPLSEMAASLHAGSHPSLVAVHATVTGHPNGKQALAMPLVTPDFQNLAGPPSLASCTRDVYAPETRFTWDALLRLAHHIASAAQHLHARGLHHGDLYAHNILCTTDGRALLGDFGAAALTDPHQPETALALQRLEVRAFGCLLEELLDRTDLAHPNTNSAHAQQQQQQQQQILQALQIACMQALPSQRPLFVQISHTLNQLVSA